MVWQMSLVADSKIHSFFSLCDKIWRHSGLKEGGPGGGYLAQCGLMVGKRKSREMPLLPPKKKVYKQNLFTPSSPCFHLQELVVYRSQKKRRSAAQSPNFLAPT